MWSERLTSGVLFIDAPTRCLRHPSGVRWPPQQLPIKRPAAPAHPSNCINLRTFLSLVWRVKLHFIPTQSTQSRHISPGAALIMAGPIEQQIHRDPALLCVAFGIAFTQCPLADTI